MNVMAGGSFMSRKSSMSEGQIKAGKRRASIAASMQLQRVDTIKLMKKFPEAPPDIVSVTLNSSKKRTAYDTCVYVTSPSDRTKRMIVVTPHDTWETFVNKVSSKLSIEAKRFFNQMDEITSIDNLVQGDVLFVQPADDDSPGREVLQSSAVIGWNRLVRMINLQCMKGYTVSEVVKLGKYSETLKARCDADDSQVIIKRYVPGPGMRMSTLKAYILQVWSVRHPNFANYMSMSVSKDPRRMLGGARNARAIKKGARPQTLVLIMKRYEDNLESLLEQRTQMQKPFTMQEVFEFTWKMLLCLHHIHHDLKIAHRNVKMSNVLFDQDGELYLSDMAIPRTDSSATNGYHMRHACYNSCAKKKGQYQVPFMAYVSPEALATGHTSTKEDMWSLGCVITELVTGKHISDRAPGSTFARNQGAVAQAIAEVGIKDTDLGDLVRILFEADCDKRPTAHEVLWKHLKHLPFQVPPEKPLPVVPADLAKIQATHLSALSKSPDIPTLVSAILRKDDFKMMEVAILRLTEILTSEPTKRASMREIYATAYGPKMTGLSALCMCMQMGTPFAQQRGAQAMRTAMLDDDNESHVTSFNIEVLVQAVITGSPQTQMHAAAALANALANHAPSREALHVHGGMGALTALMARTQGVQGAMLEAAMAIRNGCIGNRDTRQDLADAGGIEVLIKAVNICGEKVPASLRERKLQTEENLAGALRNACNQHNKNCMQLAECEGISVLMRLLNGTGSVQEQVVGLIRNACIGYHGNKGQMTKCGAYWCMVQVLHQPSISQALREEIVSAIRYSIVGSDQNRGALGEAGLLRALKDVITPGQYEGTTRCKEEAAAALRIACDASEQNSAEMLKCSGIGALLNLMATSTKVAREESVAAIANACSYFPPNLEFVGEKGRRMLTEVSQDPEMSDESRLFAKCVLVQLEQKGKRNQVHIHEADRGVDDTEQSKKFTAPARTSSSRSGSRPSSPERGGTPIGGRAATPPLPCVLPSVGGSGGMVGGEGDEEDWKEDEGFLGASMSLRFVKVSTEAGYKPHFGAYRPNMNGRWPNRETDAGSADALMAGEVKFAVGGFGGREVGGGAGGGRASAEPWLGGGGGGGGGGGRGGYASSLTRGRGGMTLSASGRASVDLGMLGLGGSGGGKLYSGAGTGGVYGRGGAKESVQREKSGASIGGGSGGVGGGAGLNHGQSSKRNHIKIKGYGGMREVKPTAFLGLGLAPDASHMPALSKPKPMPAVAVSDPSPSKYARPKTDE